MESVTIRYTEEPTLNKPILIEGLPGVGNVGKLAAEYLVKKLEAKKFASIYSKHFPPQVLIGEDGVIRLVSNDLFYHRIEGANDLIILIGDYQGTSQEGQYDLSEKVVDLFSIMGGEMVYTLGGWSVGRIVQEPRVLGAATSPEIVEKLKNAGVAFSKDEPAGGIVGAAGLLLGIGQLRGLEAACLMGETSGYFSDPKSAQNLLEILVKILNIDIDFTDLEARAKELDDLTARLEEPMSEEPGGKDELNYFG
ncbi:MAG: proteasome assembly chaperone family protein [Candidatus Proteinoplasmatales archaeon SG8-5]|nr:MAG: proteasome assembly chaperone family protein [Candidatus Proteinoplasmatales archaeon SG8-5]